MNTTPFLIIGFRRFRADQMVHFILRQFLTAPIFHWEPVISTVRLFRTVAFIHRLIPDFDYKVVVEKYLVSMRNCCHFSKNFDDYSS